MSRREACSSIFLAGATNRLQTRLSGCAAESNNMRSNDATRWIAFVAFPELTLLDLVGPLQVLRGLETPFRTAVVAEDLNPIETDTRVRIVPQMKFSDLPRPYVVVISGGPGSIAAMANQTLQTYLKRTAETATVVASVCTGALPLAATGLLHGRRASVHWAYARELKLLGARYERARFTWMASSSHRLVSRPALTCRWNSSRGS
jgi:transcriptional regulator GlxA family with amidase domain